LRYRARAVLHRHDPDRCAIRLRELRALARKHGGRCLSREYVTRQTPMAFTCREGHVWKARPATILTGHWCPVCGAIPEGALAGVEAIARERGGECLSCEYDAEPPGMHWRCAEGHEWWAPPKRIRRGAWCPFCAGRKTMADMQALAARHGGRCLSRSMADGAGDTPMEWECAQGHRFKARRRCVKVGQWCGECRRAETSWSQACARAESLGGACLVEGPRPPSASVGWRCARGHEFTSNAYRVARGSWCPRCAGRRQGIEEMQALAERHGGRCLSRKYVDSKTKLRWECAQGHRFAVAPTSMRTRWCPRCALAEREPSARVRTPPPPRDRATPTIWQRALAEATARGGVCLDAVDNPRANQSRRWRCAAGHEFMTNPYRVVGGAWCPRCAGRRLGIEHMHAMAAERGGRCVSEEFVDAYTHLQWECEKGHRWWARPTVVRCAGTWCPHCAWDQNGERMRSEARDRR
jgi:hypothetical protein